MSKNGRTWLSHTANQTLVRCPRCFWLFYRKGIRQPEGIISRLSNRFDTVLKNYFNIYRPSGKLPPLVSGRLEGRLEYPFQEKYFVRIDDKYGFVGRLDECLINDKGESIPLDFKTASSDPREKETLSAYQAQVDDYVFLLEQNKKKVAGFGYLVYVYPDHSKDLHKGFPMVIHVEKLKGEPQRTAERVAKAIRVLEGPIPKPSLTCEFCNWYETIKNLV